MQFARSQKAQAAVADAIGVLSNLTGMALDSVDASDVTSKLSEIAFEVLKTVINGIANYLTSKSSLYDFIDLQDYEADLKRQEAAGIPAAVIGKKRGLSEKDKKLDWLKMRGMTILQISS